MNDHVDFKDLDQVLGTHLSTVGTTINATQDAINQMAPVISFIGKNWLLILFIIFAVMVLASIIANKVTG